MKWLRPTRPSPALVISLIALFVALGGTGYAATQLAKNTVGTKQLKRNAVIGSKVKNSSLTGADIKNGSLTGSDLSLSSLGTVPTAANATNASHASAADNATHAGNADTVGGRSVVTFEKIVATNTTTPQTVLSLGGLTLTLTCDSSGEPNLAAIPAAQGSLIRGMRVSVGTTTQFGTSNATAGQPVTVIAATDSRGGAAFQYAQPDGHVVSVNTYVDDNNTINDFDGCSASGSAIAG
jgi:hypothetical protein